MECAPCAPRAGGHARAVVPSVAVQQDPGRERAQDEPVQARGGPQFGIRRGQQLPDSVEPEAVDLLRGHPAAHRVGGLQDHGGDSCAGQPSRRGESGDPGPHDDDVRLVRGLKHVPLLEVARTLETSFPQQAPGIREFCSRLGPRRRPGSRASAGARAHGGRIRPPDGTPRPPRAHRAAVVPRPGRPASSAPPPPARGVLRPARPLTTPRGSSPRCPGTRTGTPTPAAVPAAPGRCPARPGPSRRAPSAAPAPAPRTPPAGAAPAPSLR